MDSLANDGLDGHGEPSTVVATVTGECRSIAVGGEIDNPENQG